MHNFCTLFDINYLPRFITMYNSMVKTGTKFKIFAFCMDDECFERVSKFNLDFVIPISISQLEFFDVELHAIKSTRSLVEYYFTCTPAICNFVIVNYSHIESITYLDSDLYFFSSPDIVFDEIGNKSIAIVEHRFSRYARHFIKNGRFNVAWITFRNDEEGKRCLSEYRYQCIDWCYDYLDGDRFGDQKYLDKWPEKYNNLRIISNFGVNLAPWNLSNYDISIRNEFVCVDDDVLVFFHFANLKQLKNGVYTTSVSSYFEFLPKLVRDKIYVPYLLDLKSNTESNHITRKTLNPKYQKISINRTLKELLRTIRIYSFGDIIRL